MARRNGEPYVAPTDRMLRFALALARERVWPEYGDSPDERAAFIEREVAARRLSKWGVMRVIDELKAAPRDERPDGLVPGVYRRNGTIYVVKPNKTNPDRLHARRLVEIGGRRLTEADTVVQIEFEYDRDALLQLRPGDQMTLEEARPFIIRYGKCIYCDTPLRDAKSVERGVGPVCNKRFAPPRPPAEVSQESRERLTELLAQFRR